MPYQRRCPKPPPTQRELLAAFIQQALAARLIALPRLTLDAQQSWIQEAVLEVLADAERRTRLR